MDNICRNDYDHDGHEMVMKMMIVMITVMIVMKTILEIGY